MSKNVKTSIMKNDFNLSSTTKGINSKGELIPLNELSNQEVIDLFSSLGLDFQTPEELDNFLSKTNKK